MKKSNNFYLLLILLITFVGCAKQGDIGPKGDTGATGPIGATGDTGATGSPGNANVIVKKFTVTQTGNINTGFAWNGSVYQHFENNISELTQAVVDSGGVMLYILWAQGWSPLPWTQVVVNNLIVKSYNYAYNVNYMWIMISQSDGSQCMSPGASYDYKLVIIPPAQRLANPNVNLKNYEEVKAAFNLKD